MLQKQIEVSSGFKKQTTKAILSIVLFLVVYLLIFVLAVGLTALCVYGGIFLVISIPRFITIALGIGLASLGFLILFFLIKFIFKSNKVDRSNLIEIKQKDEPELFQMIHEIVDQVGTSFPKKVYLSADVNASVFYNSSFWSMFLPVRKNLMIGMGLVNTISREELKGILSHEFGHFSQKTMKVGSYVYNVNQVIFNMLFDNESYEKVIQGWASASGYFSIFVAIAVFIVQGIQQVLQLMYGVVNKSYMALSREMEFHADEIAAHVTGYEPLKNALLRMNLADHSYNNVLSFYEGKFAENLKSQNIYKEQHHLMHFLAKEDELPIRNGLPQVTLEELNKFNKSKLVITDQWASHPSIEDRINRLEKTNQNSSQQEDTLANTLFTNIDKTQEEVTNKLFSQVAYKETPVLHSFKSFKEAFEIEYEKNTFSKLFNGYYDNKNPLQFDMDAVDTTALIPSFGELFTDEKINLNYTALSLENDIEAIKQIAYKTVKIKTFDYDGKKYKQKESNALLIKLKEELEAINKIIRQNDRDIFRFFVKKEAQQSDARLLQKLYKNYFEYDQEFEAKNKIYTDLSEKLQFISYTTPVDEIRSNFRSIVPIEHKLKVEIKKFLQNEKYTSEITQEMRDNFELYISKDWQYFAGEHYLEDNLKTLFTSVGDYAFILSKGYFLNKKELLDYKVALMDSIVKSK